MSVQMATPPPLVLARAILEVRFSSKSILYYAHRALFASTYTPSRYANWELQTAALNLTDKEEKRGLKVEAGLIALIQDLPSEVPDFMDHAREAVERFYRSFSPGGIQRVGLRFLFLTPNTSYDSLFPAFRRKVVSHERYWAQIKGHSIRDAGLYVIQYGPENDGFSLTTGVLTGQQAISIRDRFEFIYGPDELSIEDGCLMVDIDRFVEPASPEGAVDRVLLSWDSITEIATTVATRILSR